MRLARRTVIAVALLCCLLAVTILVIRQRTPKPLGEAPSVRFPSAVSQTTKVSLLRDDFEIVTDVSALPSSVLKLFQEKGGARFLLANPGAKFIAGDVIWDASVPHRRLVLAGVSRDRCFVHYEQGGRGLSYVIAVFGLRPNKSAEPLWSGYCAKPADNLETLRSRIADGGCS